MVCRRRPRRARPTTRSAPPKGLPECRTGLFKTGKIPFSRLSQRSPISVPNLFLTEGYTKDGKVGNTTNVGKRVNIDNSKKVNIIVRNTRNVPYQPLFLPFPRPSVIWVGYGFPVSSLYTAIHTSSFFGIFQEKESGEYTAVALLQTNFRKELKKHRLAAKPT